MTRTESLKELRRGLETTGYRRNKGLVSCRKSSAETFPTTDTADALVQD